MSDRDIKDQYDVIIIGAGLNGLTTAASLTRAGKSVLVLEKRNLIGGSSAIEEFHPGYKSPGLLLDRAILDAKIVRKLGLRQYGLKKGSLTYNRTFLSTKEEAMTISCGVNKTVTSTTDIPASDIESYKTYVAFLSKVQKWLKPLLTHQQPDLVTLSKRNVWKLMRTAVSLRLAGKKAMLEILKVMPMSVRDFLDERFESELLKAGLAFPAVLGAYTGPWSAYSTLNLLLSDIGERGYTAGENGALVNVLVKAVQESGGHILTGRHVVKILLDTAGHAIGVRLDNGDEIKTQLVGASCHPKETFLKLLTAPEVGHQLQSAILNYRCRGTTSRINLALNKKIVWKSGGTIEHALLASDLTEIEQAYDAVKYRKFSEKPVLQIHVPTISDRNLAPEGHEVVSILAQSVPYDPEGGWNEGAKNRFLDIVIDRLSEVTMDLKSSIVGSEIMTPVDLESRYSLPGGNIWHGELAVDQLFGRPVPSCADYYTPIPGLYLCGNGSHPGNYLTCMPGFLAGQAMLHHKANVKA